MKSLINQRFGKLIVIAKDNTNKRKDKHIYYICRCDCGKIISVRSTLLRNNSKTSCGCELGYYQKKILDLTNQQFGKLTALYPIDKRSGSHIMWHCKCQCGKELDIDGHSLRHNLSLSCGCTKISKGEFKIQTILLQNSIKFIQEKTFETCRLPNTNRLAKFDFYIDNQYIIEYDGIQHFKENNWYTLEYIQSHDNFKNQWCKQHNIPIIRIPYTHYNKININDLLLSTSNFII